MKARFALLALLVYPVVWTAHGRDSESPILPTQKDFFGDALPKGAKFRLGTTRHTVPRSDWGSAPYALSQDGVTYAIATRSGVAIHSVATGRKIRETEAKEGYSGYSIAYSADNQSVVTTGSSGLAIWDVTAGKCRSTVEYPTERHENLLDISSGLTVAASVISRNEDGQSVLLWNPGNGKVLGQPTPVHNSVTGLTLSGNGRILATWGHYTPNDESEGEQKKASELEGAIQIWDVETKKEIRRIKIRLDPEHLSDPERLSDSERLPKAKLSPDGSVLYTTSGNSVQAWDTKTGRRLRQYIGRSQARNNLWLSADGKRLAASGENGSIDVWDAGTATPLGTGQAPPANRWWTLSFCGGSSIQVEKGSFTVALPSDSPYAVIAAVDVNRVRVTSIPNGSIETPPAGHRAAVRAVAYTQQGKELISVGGGQVIRWDAATGKELCSIGTWSSELLFRDDGISRRIDPLVSPDGRFLATATDEDLKLFDTATGKERFSIPLAVEGYVIQSLFFSANGNRLGVVREDSDESPGQSAVVWDTQNGRQIFDRKLVEKADESSSVNRAVLTPDGTKLVWAIGRQKVLKKEEGPTHIIELTGWDIISDRQLGQVEFEAYGVWLATAMGDNRSILTTDSEGKMVVWDLVTGKFTRKFDLQPESEPAVSLDGKTFAVFEQKTMTEDGKNVPSRIVIYDFATGKPIKQIVDPTLDELMCMTWSPDGKYLVTGHSDSTSIVWEVAALPAVK